MGLELLRICRVLYLARPLLKGPCPYQAQKRSLSSGYALPVKDNNSGLSTESRVSAGQDF